MPSGYTERLYQGKDQTFPEFLMGCARGMGALITMRDAAVDAKIPEQFEPSDWARKHYEETKAELVRLSLLSDDEWREQERDERETTNAHVNQSIHEKNALRARYEKMLAEAQAWRPPTPDHEGLKKLMIEQLEDSIRFDCGTSFMTATPPRNVKEYKAESMDKARRFAKNAAEEWANEQERTAGRNAWLKALRDSLDQYA